MPRLFRAAALAAALAFSAYAGPPTVLKAPAGITVTTSATALATCTGNSARHVAVNVWNDGSATIYLGFDSSVTTSGATRGIPLAAGQWVKFGPDLASGQCVWGIVASGTQPAVVQEEFQQ